MKYASHAGTLLRYCAQSLLMAAVIALTMVTAEAQDTLARIKKEGVVRIANSGVYPPFEFKEGDKLVGFDVDLSNLIADELGVKAEITVIDFKGLISSLRSGTVDLLVTAMTYRPSRAEQIAFSEPYYETAVAIAMRADKTPVGSKDELASKIVGAEFGTTGEQEARSISGVKEVKTYDTLMLALRDLEIGRTDAVISNLPNLQYLIHRNFPKTKVVATYNSGWIGINTRKEDEALLAEINRILEKLKKSGELDKLHVKWLGEVRK
jgi:ABC-type amino acid transport substrate-binding protein